MFVHSFTFIHNTPTRTTQTQVHVKGKNTLHTHTSHSLHSHAREMQRVPRSQTRIHNTPLQNTREEWDRLAHQRPSGGWTTAPRMVWNGMVWHGMWGGGCTQGSRHGGGEGGGDTWCGKGFRASSSDKERSSVCPITVLRADAGRALFVSRSARGLPRTICMFICIFRVGGRPSSRASCSSWKSNKQCSTNFA